MRKELFLYQLSHLGGSKKGVLQIKRKSNVCTHEIWFSPTNNRMMKVRTGFLGKGTKRKEVQILFGLLWKHKSCQPRVLGTDSKHLHSEYWHKYSQQSCLRFHIHGLHVCEFRIEKPWRENGVSSIYTDYFCLSSFPGQQSVVTVHTALTSHYGS